MLSLTTLLLLPAVVSPATDPGITRGREVTQALLAGDAEALQRLFSPTFVAAVGGPEGLKALVQKVATDAGRETAVREELVFHEAGFTSYYRRSRFEKIPDVTIRWVMNGDGIVQGGTVLPTPAPAASPYLDYQTKTPLRLPFHAPAEGRWYVAWGGRDPIRNYHVIAPDQRFANDFLVMKNGTLFRGDGRRNEDHYCFGQPIYAPSAGTVVKAVGDVADNARPGITNAEQPAGNHVIIDHGNGEFSLLAHFRQGSLAVHQGEKVQAGTLLGLCGNSGHSDLPHLHYHLQTGADFGQGLGLPAFFNAYRADGRAVARGEPQRGQYLDP
jgi:hypothetical protein